MNKDKNNALLKLIEELSKKANEVESKNNQNITEKIEEEVLNTLSNGGNIEKGTKFEPKNNNTSTLRAYMNEVSLYPLLNKEEEEKYIKLYQETGQEEAKNKLITANLRYVILVAMRYKDMNVDLMDLISEGNSGLMTAIDKFDPNSGVKLITYASHYIEGAIKKNLKKQLEDANFTKTTKYSPNNDLISTDIENYIDTFESNEISVEQEIENKDFKDLLLSKIDSLLSKKEKDIFMLRFGLITGDVMTYEAIGKIYGLSRERIRQIISKSLFLIKQSFKNIK